jgi:hypothetical protein
MHARKENQETNAPKELEPGEQEREREMSTKEMLIDIKILLKKIIAKPAPERKYSSKTTPRKKNPHTNATTTTQMSPPATKTSMQRKALERLETRQKTGKTEHTWEEKSEFSSLQKH